MDLMFYLIPVYILCGPVFLYLVYCYSIAGTLIYSRTKNSDQTDGQALDTAIVLGFGILGGLIIFSVVNELFIRPKISFGEEEALYIIGYIALCAIFIKWLTLKMVRCVITYHYPGTTFVSENHYFIKELGKKQKPKTRWLRWLEKLL